MEIILNFIIIALILITWYLHKNYIPKYFEEKGKNLATKEDIGDITKIVESVKFDLLKDTEVLKAQLLISNQTKFSFENVYRDALYDYNKKYSAWLNAITSFSFSEYNETNYNDSIKQLEVIKTRKYEFDLSVAHLNLFLDDEGFRKINFDLEKETIILKGLIEDTLIHYNHNYRVYNIKVETDKSFSSIETYKEATRIVKEFLGKNVKQYEITHEKYVNVYRYIREKLLKLSNN